MTVTQDSQEFAPGIDEFGPGIDPERLAVCLSVLDELDTIEVDHPDAIAVRRATAGIYRTVKQQPAPGAPGRQDRARQGRHRGHRDRLRRAHRRRDAGRAPVVLGHGRDRGHTAAPQVLLHLQDPVRRGGRLLPPALPEVRRGEPGPARRPYRPHRAPGAAHRRPGQDRHVHRAAAAARRRPHHHHHPLPQRRDPPLQGDAGQRRVDPPAEDRRDRPARPGAGRRPRRLRRRRGPPGHPDQQRRADGAPLPAGLQRAAECRVRPAARGRAPRGAGHRHLRQRHGRPRRRAPRRPQAGRGSERPGRHRSRPGHRIRLARPHRRGHGDRRGRPRARPARHQQLDPDGRGGRADRAPRGPALQLDGALHPDRSRLRPAMARRRSAPTW